MASGKIVTVRFNPSEMNDLNKVRELFSSGFLFGRPYNNSEIIKRLIRDKLDDSAKK